MFTVRRSHGRALHSLSRILSVNQPSSWFSTSSSLRSPNPGTRNLDPHGPIAQKLEETGVWAFGRPKGPKGTRVKADKSRVNVVSEKLCDDVLSYIGPSLQRHRGCDILDIYPGAGLWSSKLHEYLQPRSHILMEPDAELYGSFLKPLLEKPGTKLVPKSGIVWRELNSVLTPEYLPHQVIADKEGLDQRNDTLLVTANLIFHPRKRFINFDSITSLLLHQFVTDISTNTLFQRYGLVRMLIWTRHDDTHGFLPKTIQRRKRQSIDNDLMCEYVHEVCGSNLPSSWYARDDDINKLSLLRTLRRMRAEGFKMPAGREPEGFLDGMEELKGKTRLWQPGRRPPTFKRAYKNELAELLAADSKTGGLPEDSNEFKNMNLLKWRLSADENKNERIFNLFNQQEKIVKLLTGGKATPKKKEAAKLAWKAEVLDVPTSVMNEFVTYKDNLQSIRQNPPLLQWDRRLYEPMTTQVDEFYPNIPSALLDIQPKAPHPLLRQRGPQSNRAGEVLELMLRSLMLQSTTPITVSLDSLSPGAADYILSRWKNFQEKEGSDFFDVRHAEPVPRLMNGRHWEEIIELWMEWPFRPEFTELVGRTPEEMEDKSEDAFEF
ncbi:S-adenosyl-L-methionine-dependent methyltransferase [Xylaria nigripes]|nr:S-adenosyl-L-methionine-dependent methyltransferase [Xylaria nigripes]